MENLLCVNYYLRGRGEGTKQNTKSVFMKPINMDRPKSNNLYDSVLENLGRVVYTFIKE